MDDDRARRLRADPQPVEPGAFERRVERRRRGGGRLAHGRRRARQRRRRLDPHSRERMRSRRSQAVARSRLDGTRDRRDVGRPRLRARGDPVDPRRGGSARCGRGSDARRSLRRRAAAPTVRRGGRRAVPGLAHRSPRDEPRRAGPPRLHGCRRGGRPPAHAPRPPRRESRIRQPSTSPRSAAPPSW